MYASQTYCRTRGFTLIEVLVYLGIFSILIGGTVTAVYHMLEGSARTQTAVMLQEEGNFLIAKINWALSGVESVNVSNPTTLSVVKYTSTGTTNITITESGTDLVLQQDADPAVPLNNTNVEVSGTLFVHTAPSGSGINPESVSAHVTLSTKTPNGMVLTKEFETTAYLRK